MEYRPIIDVARLVSITSIICFHSPNSPYKSMTISGLAYFILLTFCLQGLGHTKIRSFSWKKRAARLLTPWVFWSFVYLSIGLARHQPFLDELRFHPSRLLIGPEIHLWFLPFAFLGGLFGHVLLRTATRLPGPWPYFAMGLVSVLSAAVAPVLDGSLIEPFGQWMYALPLLPIGLIFGLSQTLPREQRETCHLALLALTLWLAWRCAEPSYLLGMLALWISVPWKSRKIPWLQYLANLTMGIYLTHIFAFLIIYKYLPAVPWYLFASAGVLIASGVSGAIMSIPRLDLLAFGTIDRPGHPQSSRPEGNPRSPGHSTIQPGPAVAVAVP